MIKKLNNLTSINERGVGKKQEQVIKLDPISSSHLKTLSPAVRKLVDDNNLDPNQIIASGKDGRLLKADVLDAIENGAAKAFVNP